MSSVVRIKQSAEKPQQDDPGRARLGAALQAEAASAEAVTAARAKWQAAGALLSKTEQKLAAAVAAVDGAISEDAEMTASTGVVNSVAVRKQRQKVAELEDEVAVCAGAVTRFESQLAAKLREHKLYQVEVLAAKNSVLSPLILKVVARVDQLALDLAVARAVLSELSAGSLDQRSMPDFGDTGMETTLDAANAYDAVRAPIADARAAAADRTASNFRSAENYTAASEAAERVRTAVERLLTDADAALEIPGDPGK